VTRAAPALFIAFEGPEGAGKSTQIARLARRLTDAGRDVVVTREPGGTPAGDRIRDVVLDPNLEIAPLAEFLLYAAARAQHVDERIRPALERGATVLCDRFAASSVAYQGYGRGLDPAWVRELNRNATGGLTPDATVLLDVPSDVGMERIAARGATDRLERADLPFHRRVRDGFLAEASVHGDWIVVNAARAESDVSDAVWSALRPRLGVDEPGETESA